VDFINFQVILIHTQFENLHTRPMPNKACCFVCIQIIKDSLRLGGVFSEIRQSQGPNPADVLVFLFFSCVSLMFLLCLLSSVSIYLFI
jgi:hypothetical protein